MGISSSGIGSNLDVEAIVTSLMGQEKRPLTAISTKKIAMDAKITAFGTIKSSLASFQTSLTNLSSASKFNPQSTKSSDPTIARVTSNGKATIGDYSLNVTQLAQSAKIASTGFLNTSEPIGKGSISIEFGTYDSVGNSFTPNPVKASKVIQIDDNNNSLTGVMEAINASNAGVTATIINDGSALGNRLVITSKDTGEVNSLKITVNDTGDGNNTDLNGLSKLAFDPTMTSGTGKNASQLQAAKDAKLTVDGISLTKPSNVITDAVSGITLNLLKVSAADSTFSVTRDDLAITSSVDLFVKAFNDLNVTVKTLSKYDSENTKNNGPLIGDSTSRSIITQIKQTLSSTLSGANLTSLSNIGVSFQKDGSLSLDNVKLKAAIEKNPADVAGIFLSSAQMSDQSVLYNGSTEKTKAGSYSVNLSQLATQATMTGSTAPNLSIVDGVNDTIQVNINSINYSIKLAAGNYATSDALASEVQTKLSSAGAPVKASIVGGNLTLTSSGYGSVETIGTPSGNGSTDMFGVGTSVSGLDAQGLINGASAIGSGQLLTGAIGNPSEGLSIKIQGGALGDRGVVGFTSGLASKLNSLISKFVDSDGLLKAQTNGLTESITRLTKQQEALNLRLASIEKRYRAQFSALDVKISQLGTTSSFLTQQLAQFAANSTTTK